MRKKILELLITGKNLHLELITKYSNVLPKNIIDGANDTLSSDIPKKINALLLVLNLSESKDLFKPINNSNEAIEIFKNENIDEIIQRAILNKEIISYSLLKNENLSVEEILKNIEFGINSSIQLLQMQIATGVLTKNNL